MPIPKNKLENIIKKRHIEKTDEEKLQFIKDQRKKQISLQLSQSVFVIKRILKSMKEFSDNFGKNELLTLLDLTNGELETLYNDFKDLAEKYDPESENLPNI
jgi:hypothetical protein